MHLASEAQKKVTHEKKADIKQMTEIAKGDADHSKMLNIFLINKTR